MRNIADSEAQSFGLFDESTTHGGGIDADVNGLSVLCPDDVIPPFITCVVPK